MNTIVYVDGFNLYYGALRGTSYKWLDVVALCRALLPRHVVTGVKYFTARVSPRESDPQQRTRQQVYLRAIQARSPVEIVLGHFLTTRVRMPVADGSVGRPRFVWVTKTEEKGSDVNLATHMVVDGFRGRFEAAVVISNDSDLVEPVRVVRKELGLVVGVLNPHPRPSRELLRHASFVKPIRQGALAANQLPDRLKDGHGTIHRPVGW